MTFEISFILKKMISVGLMPLSLGVILALVSLWYIFQERIKKAKIYLCMAIAWIFIISYAPFADLMMATLEHKYPKLEVMPSNVEYILLLGGDRKRRAWEALRLHQQAPGTKIITSGFSLHDSVTAAEKTAKILEESGVKKENILMQSQAKDTHEEAQYMKDRVGVTPFVLVTSAYHMPRAMVLFQKAGLKPIAAPTDFSNPNESSLFTVLEAEQLEKTEQVWHEHIGLLWIKVKSFI